MSDATPIPSRMSELLSVLGRRLGLDHPAEVGVVWSRWSEIVGPDIARHAEPSSLRSGMLRVRAESPAWANEIAYLADEIRERANATVGRALVAEVKVWTGPGPIPRSAAGAGAERADETRASAVPDDPRDAFERARRAWLQGRRR